MVVREGYGGEEDHIPGKGLEDAKEDMGPPGKNASHYANLEDAYIRKSN
jgi:hypothetical protein